MSKRFASLFAALALALAMGLLAPNAFAQLSVTATQASGAPGDNVNLTFILSSGGSGDEVDLSKISAYTFNFFWDPLVLDWNSYSSTPVLSAGPTPGSGSAVFDWVDVDPFASPVSFAGGLSITANFHILDTAAYGASTIAFGDNLGGSVLVDENGNLFSFSDVTQDNPMQVTVTPIPEPAEVSMLMAGLGLMALVLRRRRNQA